MGDARFIESTRAQRTAAPAFHSPLVGAAAALKPEALFGCVRMSGARLVESLCAVPLVETIAPVLCGFSTKAALVLGRLAALTSSKARRGDSSDRKGEGHCHQRTHEH